MTYASSTSPSPGRPPEDSRLWCGLKNALSTKVQFFNFNGYNQWSESASLIDFSFNVMFLF